MAAERSASDAPAAQGSAVSEALAQYKRGSLTLEQYLDIRADQAVAHLQGVASSQQLQTIRGIVREQLTTRPDLIELLRRAGVELPAPATGP